MHNYSNTTLAKCNPWLDQVLSALFWAIRDIQPLYIEEITPQDIVNRNVRYIVEDTTTDIEFQVTRHLKEYDFNI
jgi:hypothetical protein